ncbi:MAG: glutamate 5-kinase [Spirochaetia bacterium]|nr:glutamate 5-kinase [Spirochaetia bacterium]
MNRQECIQRIQKSARIVIKIGTSLLTDPLEKDGINKEMIAVLRDEILYLRKKNIQTVLVTSGSQGMGRHAVRTAKKNSLLQDTSISRKQALAAIGQGKLMSVYSDIFEKSDLLVAQILITARDFRDRRTYINIGHTMEEILKMGGLPIVNENDTVLTDELQFGDNDVLSSACAALLEADALLILTSVDGFQIDQKKVSFLDSVGSEEMKHAGGSSGPGTGGMVTKLRAAQLCSQSGAISAILPGRHPSPIQSLLEGEEIGTLICSPPENKLTARKKWLLYARNRGSVVVDQGARIALVERGSSLLPAGILKTEGEFFSGDVIEIKEASGISIGRGIVNYSDRELESMLGMKVEELRSQGQNLHADEVIHRNNMILES